MRIRRRAPRAVEVVRAAPAPVFEDKSDSVPKPVHTNANATPRLERCDVGSRFYGGSVEPTLVVTKDGIGISALAYVCSVPDEERVNGIETSVIHSNSEQRRVSNGSSKQKVTSSKGLLMKSLLVVFERAGTQGLTAREAVAKLGEYDLPGLQEGERPSVQVAKALRTPDFVHLEDGKYFIYPSTPHAVVAESSTQSESSSQQQATLQARQDVSGNVVVPGLKRKRKTSVSDGSKDNATSDAVGKAELKKRRRRPPSSQHELGIGPRQCKRYDGRGWQCSRETEEGFSFCEHHQTLMNKRTLRLNLAKKRRKGGSTTETTTTDMDVDQQPKAGLAVDEVGSSQIPIPRDQQLVVVASSPGIEDLIHNQRRRLVKARSLKSIK